MNAKSLLASPVFIKTGFLLALCALLPLRAAPAASHPLLTPRPAANPLQLVVAAPATLDLLRADNVTGALTTLIENVFRQSGFRGGLTAVSDGEAAQAGAPALEISLLDWRIAPGGNVDCTFAASLTTATGRKDLGLFDGTSLPMFGLRDAFDRAEAFDQAATDAIDNLYGELREKNLLPAAIL